MIASVPNIAALFDTDVNLTGLRRLISRHDSDWWLVGGCLRDLLLERPVSDIDIVAAGDPTKLARQWARQVGGSWFQLDTQRGYSRVLLPDARQIDFSPLRAPSIEDDLRLRDYTINALAFRLSGEHPSEHLLDPLNGRADLFSGTLRCCSTDSFIDDPLRMLKGIRHAVTLSFRLSDRTRLEISRQAPRLKRIAGERIREELFMILNSPSAVDGLQLLWETQLLQPLWGEPDESWRPDAVWPILQEFSHSLENLPHEPIATHADPPSSDRSARGLFLLARFLEAYRPRNLAGQLHQRLRFSRADQRLLSRLLGNDPERPRLFAQLGELEGRRLALAVETLQPCACELLFYQGVLRGKLDNVTARSACRIFRTLQHHGRMPDRISGKRIAALTGMDGPALGEWKFRIKHAEINGEISSDEDAEEWLRKKISIDMDKT